MIRVNNGISKAQKYFRTSKGKIAEAAAQEAYLSTDEGKRSKSLAQKAYLNTGNGKLKLINAQKSYFNSDKGKGKLINAQKTYFNSDKGKGKHNDAQKAYFNSDKGKGKLIDAKKSYYTTVKGIQNKHMVNKQYYDSFCNKESLESNSIKHLAYSKRALDRIVSQESNQSALISSSNDGIECTPSLTNIESCTNDEHCSVQNPDDKRIVNNNSDKVLLSIREHEASAAVCKRFNKDIAKKT